MIGSGDVGLWVHAAVYDIFQFLFLMVLYVQ